MTDLPDDVYDLIERVAAMQTPTVLAQDLLAKYPRSQPEPAWQDGDAVIADGRTWSWYDDAWFCAVDGSRLSDDLLHGYEVDIIVRGGRRVHPARFAEHATVLRSIAERIPVQSTFDELRRIADELDGDNDA